MQKRFEDNLNQAVNDGKITEQQKALILKKHNELHNQRQELRDSFRNLTPEERKAQMEERRSEIEAWASENEIDVEYLMHFGKGHGPRGAK